MDTYWLHLTLATMCSKTLFLTTLSVHSVQEVLGLFILIKANSFYTCVKYTAISWSILTAIHNIQIDIFNIFLFGHRVYYSGCKMNGVILKCIVIIITFCRQEAINFELDVQSDPSSIYTKMWLVNILLHTQFLRKFN